MSPAYVMTDARTWQSVWVRLAVALAFADASIVVLALPEIVDRLHTSISHVVWVIIAYNLALIAGCAAVSPLSRRLSSARALVAGLAVFGLASVGCGAADSLAALVPLRAVQGFGGALVLCASLPLLAGAARPGDPRLRGWAAAAALGAAVGPAAGGVLTQIFSWRSIFLAQAPVAAIAAVAVIAVRVRPAIERADEPQEYPPSMLDQLSANLALTFLSAGLIGALFLVVLELISAWLVSPIGAAAIVLTIPVTTAISERALRGYSPIALGAVGAALVAAGLLVLSLITHRELGLVVLALALCGTGLGAGFPGLTSAALQSAGSASARAAKTVAARDAGLVLGLLVLTPIFVNQLNDASNRATRQAAGVVLFSPLPIATKIELAQTLPAAVNGAPQSRPPDLAPVFKQVSAEATAPEQVQLAQLSQRLNSIVQRAATAPFKRPFQYAALFALAVLPLLGIRTRHLRRRLPA